MSTSALSKTRQTTSMFTEYLPSDQRSREELKNIKGEHRVSADVICFFRSAPAGEATAEVGVKTGQVGSGQVICSYVVSGHCLCMSGSDECLSLRCQGTYVVVRSFLCGHRSPMLRQVMLVKSRFPLFQSGHSLVIRSSYPFSRQVLQLLPIQ